MTTRQRFVLLSFGILFSQWGHAQMTCPPGMPADICQFETKVYTGTDFKKTEDVRNIMAGLKGLMMTHVKDTPMIQEHILILGDQILEQAFNQRAPKDILALANGKKNLIEMLKVLKPWEAEHGQIIPLDWHLPAGFTIAVSNLERSYDVATGRVRFSISFFAVLDRALEIEQLQVSRYGGPVVIDKAAGVGHWNQDQKFPFISAGSPWQETPYQDGLYVFTVKVKGQPEMNGWYYLHGTSATSPVVLSPQVNEKLHTSTPTFNFQDFKSSAIAVTDHSKRAMQVFHEGDNQAIWQTREVNPSGEPSITLGQNHNEIGAKELAPGSYRLNLVFEERSYFGDMTIGRLCNTSVPFGIVK